MLSSSMVDIANGNGDDLSIPDYSKTKNVHFKDSDVSPNDVMVVDPIPKPSLSWKDMLVGKETLDQNNKNDGQHFADSFAFTEQDVKKYFIDGVPSIDFLERVYQLLEKEMSTLTLGETEKGELSGRVSTTTAAVGKDEYGPWMLVERKSRCGNLKGNKKGKNLKWEETQGSRFHSLADLVDLEAVQLEAGVINSAQVAMKNKGKAPLISSQIKAPTGRKQVNGFKKSTMDLSVVNSPKGQARDPMIFSPLAG
ncbi:hypothetical protein J1N35_007888 [Gossypium stocksii]|uniref:Uncharacterized protein n=1 Tax=Gossypium stocksii TaxID=47602 RepID=A0A9D4AFZ9_9ROSI|nr:hypothetical protein J1N35_007888 [Gossypium stocksii]